MKKISPLLKWAGGKRWLVPRLKKLYSGQRWVEPFIGGMGATMGILPTEAILGELCWPLVNFYRWVQEGMEFTLEVTNTADEYYARRRRFNEIIDSSAVEAAQLFYYLNRTTFNGLWRVNRSGEFNAPHGRYKKPILHRNLTQWKTVMSGWIFDHCDFSALETKPGDFIYSDPPFDGGYVGYTKEGFSWQDQERLVKWLANHDGPVVASNLGTDRIRELYFLYGFEVETVLGPRRISCSGDRTPAEEILATRL